MTIRAVVMWCIGMLSAAQAWSDVIWDEVVDGDLSNVAGEPTFVQRLSSADRVIGTVGGPDPGEFRDVFTFDVPFGLALEAMVLNDYIAAGGNITTGFTLFTGNRGNFGTSLGSRNVGESQIGESVIVVDTPSGLLPAGSYSMNILEGTPGQSYELDILLRDITVWNEADDGDLSSDNVVPTEVVLTDLENIVIGTVGGGGSDRIDNLTVSVPQGFELTITLLDYVAAGGNANTGFNLHAGSQGIGGPDLGDNNFGQAQIGRIISAQASPLPAGNYSLVMIEDTPGQSYVLGFSLSSILVFADGFE